MAKSSILILLGTGRDGRQSEYIAHFVYDILLSEKGIATELVDVRDHMHDRTIRPEDNAEETSAWRAIADKADGFIFVLPEYNHGYPGEFKIVLDGAYEEYERKPAGLVTVSDGRFGGARLADHLLPVLHTVGLIVVKKKVHVAQVDNILNPDGTLDAKSAARYTKQVKGMMDGMQSLLG